MSQLTYLVDEICAGVEIYYTGRTGGQYFKTAFILCDDYTELTSKLFLLTDNPRWQDRNAAGRFKNYHNIQTDVQDVIRAKRPADLPRVQALHTAMTSRRERRNDFFHSTHLLDYGKLLFGTDWDSEVQAARNLDSLDILLRLERKGFSDPSITPKMNRILSECPRNRANAAKKGVHVAEYPEDLHLRLSVIYGGQELRDKLAALL